LVPQLATYWPSVVELLDMNLLLLDLDEARFRDAQTIREQHGLLTSDSLVLAAAQTYRITNLATRDEDFDEVPWLTVCRPGDIP
jgi:predicted nucleic acid-binding protein